MALIMSLLIVFVFTTFQRSSKYPFTGFSMKLGGFAWDVTKNGEPWRSPGLYHFVNRGGHLQDAIVCICDLLTQI